MRGAWIEMPRTSYHLYNLESPPMRGAWIEIHIRLLLFISVSVAPHAGGVD